MKKVRYGVLTIALLSSGTYLFVYLYRWEWHRALVAGVLFVAAEIGLASTAILDRLRSIEGRLQGGTVPTPAAPETLARLKEAAPEPRTNFDWLSSQRSELSVFVPLLLGAGVVLSAAAWLVERVSRVTAGSALERGLANRLVPLSLPAGTLAGAPAPVARRRSVVPHVAVALGAVAVATLGLDTLADATQTRPDPKHSSTTASAVVVNIASRTPRTSIEATRALWGACTTQLGNGHQVVRMSDLGGGDVHVVVKPQIGKYAERRLRGCIADATTDKIMASVASVRPVGG